jgi:UDP-glucose 4-epimerase
MGNYYRIPPDTRDLNYAKFVEEGDTKLTHSAHGDDYNSHNTHRLDLEGMKKLLLKLAPMRQIASGDIVSVEEG